MQLSRVVLRALPIATAVGLFAGCGTAAKLVGQGGECEQATDCEDGLVCIPEKDGSHKCDSDLSGIQAPPEFPDAGAKDAAASDGTADATTPIDDATTPPDTSPPADVIAPPPDTSVPPVDAAKPDTSAPPADSAAD